MEERWLRLRVSILFCFWSCRERLGCEERGGRELREGFIGRLVVGGACGVVTLGEVGDSCRCYVV